VSRLVPFALAFVSSAALLSGCAWRTAAGPVASDEPRLSRAEFVSRVEATCERRARTIAQLPRPRTKRDRKSFFATVAALEREEAQALASVHPPRRDEAEFARLAAASTELAEIAERFVDAVTRNDAHERRRAVADAERVSAAYDRAARRLRLACRQSA
jgi:hypothetical protein